MGSRHTRTAVPTATDQTSSRCARCVHPLTGTNRERAVRTAIATRKIWMRTRSSVTTSAGAKMIVATTAATAAGTEPFRIAKLSECPSLCWGKAISKILQREEQVKVMTALGPRGARRITYTVSADCEIHRHSLIHVENPWQGSRNNLLNSPDVVLLIFRSFFFSVLFSGVARFTHPPHHSKHVCEKA